MSAIRIILALSLWVTATWGLQLFNDVPTYFGGTDNDVYLTWAQGIAANYSHSVYLSDHDEGNNGMAIHWKLDRKTKSIRLALAARATGWMALGFSENGGMFGSDVVYWETEKPDILNDAYILDTRGVSLDNCQDWKLIDSQQEDEFIMIQASRLWNTTDTQDRVLLNDSAVTMPLSHIIAAWGDDVSIGYHGHNHARGMLRWFSNRPMSEEALFEKRMKQQASGSFVVQVPNFVIPQAETTYHHVCLHWKDLLAQGVPNNDNMSLIGFRAIVNPETTQYVHHANLYVKHDSDLTSNECDGVLYMTYLSGWAPGMAPLMLPSKAGFPFGPSSFTSFKLEVHYNNPTLDANVVDNFAYEFFYTSTPREIEVGILMLGDPDLQLSEVPVGDGIVEATFECQGECSEAFLQDTPVTVVQEYMHMHQAGVSMSNKLLRNGQVVHTSTVHYFDYSQSGAMSVQQQPFTVYPGDAFTTSCTYSSAPGSNLIYGHSSASEMCVAFVWYYPRRQLFDFPWICGYNLGAFDCDSVFSSRSLSSSSDVARTFGTVSNRQCTTPSRSLNNTATTTVSAMEGKKTTSHSH
jgi:hypothetical protein